MQIVYFVLIGILAGWLAGKLMKGSGFGLLGNLIVGVLGAVLGGFAFQILGISAYTMLGQLVVATVGAVLLLFLLRFVRPGGRS